MSKGIIWCRVSTDAQEWKTQKADLIADAKKQGFREEDLIVIGKKGASAIKMNEVYQQEVNELIETINGSLDITTIFVWEISRLARNELAFYQMKDAIVKSHIQLICKVPQLKLLDDDGSINSGSELTLNLLVTLAKQEMEQKIKRFKRGKENLAKQGKYSGGEVPYGYRVDKERDNLIVIDEKESNIVHEIYDMYEQGFSQHDIAKELYLRGVKGRGVRKTKFFTLSLVHQILTNELLTGEPHKGVNASYMRTYPQIITKEQFSRCRKIATSNKKSLKPHRVYYATGLIRCLGCNHMFSSTGSNGYYHCRYALRSFRVQFDGYEGERCSNNACISVNIMDSLLWELAIDFESTDVLDASQERINNLLKAKETLKQKIDAIPNRLKEIEKRREYLLDALSEGLDKSKYNDKKAKINSEEREIQKELAQYMEEMLHYDTLIEDTRHRYELTKNLEENPQAILKVRERIAAINDDKERYNIIHRHIKEVTIEKTTFNHKFKNHPEGKDTKAKLIKVYPYEFPNRRFIFIPFDGKGGTMLEWYSKRTEEPVNIMGKELTVPEYKRFDMEYLPRIVRVNRMGRREKIRQDIADEKRALRTKMKKDGYISMPEMIEISHRRYNTIYTYISNQQLHAEKVGDVWFVKEQEFMDFISKKPPVPRKDDNKTGEERLIETVKMMTWLYDDLDSEK